MSFIFWFHAVVPIARVPGVSLRRKGILLVSHFVIVPKDKWSVGRAGYGVDNDQANGPFPPSKKMHFSRGGAAP